VTLQKQVSLNLIFGFKGNLIFSGSPTTPEVMTSEDLSRVD